MSHWYYPKLRYYLNIDLQVRIQHAVSWTIVNLPSLNTILSFSQGKAKHKLCADCNKRFCIKTLGKDYCVGAKPGTGIGDDIEFPEKCGDQLTATCFQRDSYKDEIIVWLYIALTASLLVFALLKPLVKGWWT
ncbi:6516_t:CDS:2, partial [Ambispora leptoticha]